ncbi:LysR family transcriptional regulator [Desertihabitans aurantiacus]|uniref:LysR family transcriptional regulator n=1 Tax=Desertihabitans aurantiacus TaxID=2282477 RepID=UPI000DF847FD|nr:LysR family transcriptional regulator [Desertihabitans aurantiacus]
MLDLQRLRAFRAVIATGSVAAAATRLGYTPSAISQQITALQRETGLTLFEKNGRGLVPTPAGELLASESDAMMSHLAHLDGVVDDLKAGRTAALKIRCFPSMGEALLPTVVARLREELPDVSVRVDLSDNLTAEDAGSSDLCLHTEGLEDHQPVPKGRRRMVLAEEDYYAVVCPDHPLAGLDEVSLADVVEHPWVQEDLGDTACARIMRDAWRAVGRTPRTVVRTSSHSSAIAFAAVGLGVFIGPYLTVKGLGPDVRVMRVVAPTPRRRDVVSVRQDAERNPAARRLLEVLLEVIEADPGMVRA